MDAAADAALLRLPRRFRMKRLYLLKFRFKIDCGRGDNFLRLMQNDAIRGHGFERLGASKQRPLG